MAGCVICRERRRRGHQAAPIQTVRSASNEAAYPLDSCHMSAVHDVAYVRPCRFWLLSSGLTTNNNTLTASACDCLHLPRALGRNVNAFVKNRSSIQLS